MGWVGFHHILSQTLRNIRFQLGASRSNPGTKTLFFFSNQFLIVNPLHFRLSMRFMSLAFSESTNEADYTPIITAMRLFYIDSQLDRDKKNPSFFNHTVAFDVPHEEREPFPSRG